MADCTHNHVTLEVRYRKSATITSWDQFSSRAASRIAPERLATGIGVVLVSCAECGQHETVYSNQYADWPAYIRRHWDRVAADNPAVRDIARFYHMVLEPVQS